MITLERSISFSKAGSTSKQKSERQTKAATNRVPRVSRIMALAIRFDKLIRDGIVTDQAELARLGRVTRSRMTQIMNLLCLAPVIQEEILHLPSLSNITERCVRQISLIPNWKFQFEAWKEIHHQ